MPYTPLQMAEAFIQAGELSDAVDALMQHLEANPADDAARRLRAQVLARMSDETHQRMALDDLSQLTQPTTDDAFRRSIVLERLGDTASADDILTGLYRRDPTNERIAERYFFTLMARGRYAEARNLLDTMPHTWDWLEKAGDLASEYEGEAQAIQYYTQAIEHLETQFDTSVEAFALSIKSNMLAKRAQMYATLGQFTEADADYVAAEALAPDDPTLTFWHSFVAVDLGDEQRALTLCRTALENAGEGWRSNMIQSLKVMRDGGRYRALADAVLISPDHFDQT
jgi:tetratricopeptide (TPR) repeat protein